MSGVPSPGSGPRAMIPTWIRPSLRAAMPPASPMLRGKTSISEPGFLARNTLAISWVKGMGPLGAARVLQVQAPRQVQQHQELFPVLAHAGDVVQADPADHRRRRLDG